MISMHGRRESTAGRLLAVLLVLGAGRQTTTAWAQNEAEPPKDLTRVMDQGFAELIGRYDWQRDAPNVKRAMESLFEQNGWDTESDRFAKQLASEVAEIRPWDPMRRIDFVSSKLADRYGIPQAGEFRIKTRMMLDVSEFFGRHAEVIFEQTHAFMSKRMAGEPYTAEEVAEWSKATVGMNAELRDWGNRMYREIATMVDADGLSRLDDDFASFEKRMAYIEKMDKVWRAGGWKPSHWGMQDDPIQKGTHSGMRIGNIDDQAAKKSKPRSPYTLPTKWYPHDQHTWIAYMLQFKRRYGFDQGQLTAIDSIHTELLSRANAYTKWRVRELDQVPARNRPKHELYQPICALFSELCERLDAVPTTGQKETAVRKDRPAHKKGGKQE